MGLDMRPMGKPQQGQEMRFRELFAKLSNKEVPAELSWLDKLRGKKAAPAENREEILKEWLALQIPSYETIKAPRVGRDKEANLWIAEKYQETDKAVSEAQFIADFDGYYVIELAKELDGVPVYIAMGQDENVFRGQFIDDCDDLIGEALVNEAWETKLADEALDYGNRLMVVADKIAKANNLQYLKTQYAPPDVDENNVEFKLHIIYSLAKWLIFYGKNGHGYEADF